MILRRITKHVKDQNWFAVALDFFIVVAGILIAFQITNWNEARHAAEAQSKLMQRLTEEFTVLEEELAVDSASYESTVQATGTLLRLLRAESPPADLDLLKYSIWEANHFRETPSLSAAYTELVSNGGMSSLTNSELRVALFKYGDQHERYRNRYSASISMVLDPNSNYMQAVEWSEEPADWEDPVTAIISYDWGKLLNSKAELQSWQAVQSDATRNVKLIHEEVQNILTLLESEVD